MQSVHEEHEYLEITAIHKTDLTSLILIGLGSYSNLAQSIFYNEQLSKDERRWQGEEEQE